MGVGSKVKAAPCKRGERSGGGRRERKEPIWHNPFFLPPFFLAFALGGSERLIADNAAKLVSTERKGGKEGEMEWERKWNERRKKKRRQFLLLRKSRSLLRT